MFPWAVPQTEHTSDTLRAEDGGYFSYSLYFSTVCFIKNWLLLISNLFVLGMSNFSENSQITVLSFVNQKKDFLLMLLQPTGNLSMYKKIYIFPSSAAAVRIGYEEHMPGQVGMLTCFILFCMSCVPPFNTHRIILTEINTVHDNLSVH